MGSRLKPIFLQVKRHNLQNLVRSKEQQAGAPLSENREKGQRLIMLSGENVESQSDHTAFGLVDRPGQAEARSSQ